ncbi:PEP-CTERM sorting domain-containing protein [Duganella sp. BJB1802]|uniref:PEP-CTERM sorting domain-containing protein n=1 Tax=Duganella sp. BJB1802 TaxID=2744575 RepID=UPI001E53F1BC|nr:PEP-CTERM sorting domain-containing protein [Duganella sp. BJB1802]
MRRFALVLLGLFCAASAHAELITFEYTGTINTLRESNLAVTVSHSVVSSKMVAGGVRVGDDFHGAFVIDTSIPLDSGTPGVARYMPSPNSPAAPASYMTFDKTGTSVSSLFGAPSINVFHAAGSSDSIFIAPQSLGISSIFFWFNNPGSTILSDLSIPSNFNLNAWFNANAGLSVYDWANDRSLNMSGMLTSITKVSAVPEPESYAMLLAGLALVSGVAARRKKQRG